MPQPDCDDIPLLDELLHLSAAAAGSCRPAAAGGGASTVAAAVKAAWQGVSNKGVMFGMPDGGDVNFYELRPVQLMNMLTNDA